MVNFEVVVQAIRLLTNSKNLRAYADIRIQPINWLIRDWRIIKVDGQLFQVNGPQTSWRDPTSGQIRIKQILSLPDEQRQIIEACILSAYHQRVKESRNDKPETTA